ncbi:MAG: molybdopterin-dependent oxidoreductase [Candidatus Aminicenantales bacterium]
MSMSLKRRDFLKVAGGATLGFSLAACTLEQITSSVEKHPWTNPVERWVPTVCGACSGGCGIRVRVIDGRAVKVEGNPLHPLNRGSVCPKGQAGLQMLYHPERIKDPLLRPDRKRPGHLRPVSWEKALEQVVKKLLELRRSGQPQSVVILGRNCLRLREAVVGRFAKAYGTPNVLLWDEWTAFRKAYALTQGIQNLMAYDLQRARYVLSFGANFLTTWPTALENQRIYGERRARGDITLIQVEPRFSLEASRADRWIPVNPGTEGLFAAGIASVIVKEKLYDSPFIQKFTERFTAWSDASGAEHPGYEQICLNRISLDEISDATGVPLRDIIEIAKEFAAHRPAVALSDFRQSFYPNGLQNLLSIHALNALAGNIDRPGGIVRQREAPLKETPLSPVDEVARAGLDRPRIDGSSAGGLMPLGLGFERLAEAVTEEIPYPVKLLILLDPIPPLPPDVSEKFTRALEKIPLIIDFAAFSREAHEQADLILPKTTYFEKWEEARALPLFKIPVVGVGQPAVPPLYRSRPVEDVFLSIARNAGKELASHFPWTDHKQLLFQRLEGLFEAQRGCVFTNEFEESQIRLLEERGWWIPQHTSLQAFLQDILQKGGWQDPAYHFNERSYIYQNSSRRFVFFPPPTPPPASQGMRFNPDEAFPFLLYLHDLPFQTLEERVGLPFHQENLGFRFAVKWKTWVEIHPDAAEALHIQDKEPVLVESVNGKIRAIAKIFPGILPHLAAVPVGKKQDLPGKKDFVPENHPLRLLAKGYDPETGVFIRHPVRVRITRDRSRGAS